MEWKPPTPEEAPLYLELGLGYKPISELTPKTKKYMVVTDDLHNFPVMHRGGWKWGEKYIGSKTVLYFRELKKGELKPFARHCSGCHETIDGYHPSGTVFHKKHGCAIGAGCKSCNYKGFYLESGPYDSFIFSDYVDHVRRASNGQVN